ncbi:uncharacterized protein LOC131842988 [Achroia grisella]|uniref:uncharacterized protein LOC131842988 n=1 Tax=Achroia grisella TaxID=688607 RepID=UPI0027D2F78B|nr:uncharacterized protein LOC131842988 [Achroia grisella]
MLSSSVPCTDGMVRHHAITPSSSKYLSVHRTKKLYQLHRRNSHKARKKCPICKKVLGPNADLKKHMLKKKTHTARSVMYSLRLNIYIGCIYALVSNITPTKTSNTNVPTVTRDASLLLYSNIT